jgi:hypothetical protein
MLSSKLKAKNFNFLQCIFKGNKQAPFNKKRLEYNRGGCQKHWAEFLKGVFSNSIKKEYDKSN